MKRFKFYCALALFFPFALVGQTTYYKTDSLLVVGGIKIIDAGEKLNSQVCRIQKMNKEIELSPSEVLEYGLSSGQVYVARSIQIDNSEQRVFLERLVKGKVTLYYFRGKGMKTYFIEKDSSKLIEVPRHNRKIAKYNFRKQVAPAVDDCDKVKSLLSLVSYTKISLSKYISCYNNCESNSFPFIRYGILIGDRESKLTRNFHIQDSYARYLDLIYLSSFTLGGFIDVPLYGRNVSVHTELYVSCQKYSYSAQSTTSALDFIGSNSSISIPLLVRYTFLSKKIRPFINAGVEFTNNFKSDYAFYKTDIQPNFIKIDKVNDKIVIESNRIGFAAGAGLEYKLNYRHSLFLETRYTLQYGMQNAGVFNNSIIQILTGFNF